MLGYGGPKPGRGAGVTPPGASGGNFTYRPGGPTIGRTFASWPALYAAYTAAIAAGERGNDIIIDDSIVSPAVMPAGAYVFDPTTVLRGQLLSSGLGGTTGLSLADGVTWVGLTSIADTITVETTGSAPVITASGGTAIGLLISRGSHIFASGAAPLIDVPVGEIINLPLELGAILLTGATPVINVDGFALFNAFAVSSVDPGAVSGGATGTIFWFYGDESAMLAAYAQPAFTGLYSIGRFESQAHGNWQPVTVSSDPYLVGLDESLVCVDATSTSVLVILPLIIGENEGRRIAVKKVDSSGNLVEVAGSAGELVEGLATYPLIAPGDVVDLIGVASGPGAPVWRVV